MSGSVFVDTNVLVYAFDRGDAFRQGRASALLSELMDSRTMVLSTQVLKELYVVVTRKLARPLPHDEAAAIVNGFVTTSLVVEETLPMSRHALALLDEHQLSLWDACIVAAAAAAGCERLASEDLGHGRAIEGVRIENPFA